MLHFNYSEAQAEWDVGLVFLHHQQVAQEQLCKFKPKV